MFELTGDRVRKPGRVKVEGRAMEESAVKDNVTGDNKGKDTGRASDGEVRGSWRARAGEGQSWSR